MTLRSHVAKRIIDDLSGLNSTSSVVHHGNKSSGKKLKVAKRLIADDSSQSSISSAGRHLKKKSSKKLKVSMAERYQRHVTGAAQSPILEEDMVSVIPDPVDYNSLVNTISKELLKYSGRQKLEYILQSKYIDGDYDKFVALYVDVAQKLPVTFIDFRKFHKRLFISYGVIDAFFYLMNQQFHASYMSFGYCDWFTAYMEPTDADPEKLKKVLDRVIDENDDAVFIPIFVSPNHWILAVVYFHDFLIHVYDSLDGKNIHVVSILQQRIAQVYGSRHMWKVVDHYHDSGVQRQNDNCSCAFFTCWYAYQLATSSPFSPWEYNWDTRTDDIPCNVMSSVFNRCISM